MSDGNSLINVGDISQPMTTFIEKISDAIGGLYRPHQIRRIASAEADAARIQATAQLEISELQRRALQRFVAEEGKKQANIESITRGAIANIGEDAKAEELDDDWISHFFERCRSISDEKMQELWSALLAGEANVPGQFSRRTIDVLASLDKQDAQLFQCLCSLNWTIRDATPLVLDYNSPVYTDAGITFDSLQQLDAAGLVSFQVVGGYTISGLPKHSLIHYHDTPVLVEFPGTNGNVLDVGCTLLTQAGQQLVPICKPAPRRGFIDHVMNHWKGKGLAVSIVEGKRPL